MLLLATVTVSFTASAKSFTLVVDDASRVVVRNSLDGYNIVTFENNSYTFEGSRKSPMTSLSNAIRAIR